MTRNYLRDWTEEMIDRPFERLVKATRARGVGEAHFGGMRWYIALDVLAEPADQLEVTSAAIEGVASPASIDQAIFGLLDGLATSGIRPVFGVHLSLLAVAVDPVHSSPPPAFRLAGRD